jgi:transcriptional regulator of arginine metabolism
MQKTNRLLAIEKIISEENVANQEDIIRSLKSKGISCTQATLSRNLRQLGVGRVADGNGGYRYTLPESLARAAIQNPRLNLVPVVVDIIEAKGLMIVKTLPGNASNTALFIDGSGRYEIAGTIAGDDTILIVPRDGITLQQVHDCLEVILPGIHEQIKRKI